MDEEKKYLASLDFKIEGGLKNLSTLSDKLEEVSKKAEIASNSMSEKLQKSLETSTSKAQQTFKNIDFSKVIDPAKFEQQLKSVNKLTDAQAKSLTSQILKNEDKIRTEKAKTYGKQLELSDKLTYAQKKNDLQIAANSKNSETKITEFAEKQAQKRQTIKEKEASAIAIQNNNLNNKLIAQNQKLQNSLTQNGDSDESFGSKLGTYAKTFLIYQGFNQLKQAAFDTVESMKSVESRMSEISRIMADGSVNVQTYRNQLIGLAYDYARSFDEVSTITLNFARAGYNAQESLQLTKESLLALNTAELDANQATDGLISIMAQWGMDTGTATEKAQNLESIIDKINKTADAFPISSEGLLEALKRTSQGFNLAGASIDETIAMIVAAERAAQRGGKTIGTAMSNMAQQLKTDDRVTLAESLGIKVFADEAKTQFVPITELFENMSEKMTELKNAGKENSTEMQSLLELFTVFRRNIGAGLLSQMDGSDSTYMQALTTSMDSLGYSAQENSKYMNTASAASEQFNAKLLELQTTLWDNEGRGFFYTLISSGKGVMDILSGLISTFGSLPVAIGTATLAFNTFNKTHSISYENYKKLKNNIQEANDVIKAYNRGLINTSEINLQNASSSEKYVSSLNNAQASMKGYAAKAMLMKASSIAAAAGATILNAAITMGLSIAITAAVSAISNLINAHEELIQKAKDSYATYSSNNEEIDSYKDKITSLKEELESETITQKEALDKRKELSQIQDELVKKYGKEAEGINLVTGSLDNQLKAIDELSRSNYNNYLQENYSGIEEAVKTLEEKTTSMNKISLGFGNSFSKNLKEQLVSAISDAGGNSFFKDSKSFDIVISNKSKTEIIESYRNLFDKIKEMQGTLTGEDYTNAEKTKVKISEIIKKYEDEISGAKEVYNNYINQKMMYDAKYSNEYEAILKARSDLETATASGDNKKIEEANQNLIDKLQAAITKAGDEEGVKDLFQKQLDEVQQAMDNYKFKIAFDADTDGLKEQINSIMDKYKGMSVSDFLNFKDSGTDEQKADFQELSDLATKYGASLKDYVLPYLQEMGVLQAGNTDVTVDYSAALAKNIDTLASLETQYSTLKNAISEVNENGTMSAATFNSLADGNLLQYLTLVNGQLSINEVALLNSANAAKEEAAANMQSETAKKIHGIITDDLSGKLKATEGAANSGAAGLTNITNQTLTAVKAFIAGKISVQEFNKALKDDGYTGGDIAGLSANAINQINAAMGLLDTQLTALNSVKLTVAKASNSTGSSNSGSSNSAAAAAEAAQKAAEDAANAAETKRKAALQSFEDDVTERERLEQRWVKKQKDLGAISGNDEKYIIQQSISRYKKYAEEVNQLSFATESEKAELRKKYLEQAEDLEVEYFSLLKSELEDSTKAAEENYDKQKELATKNAEDKINLIKETADAEIAAINKVQDEKDRLKQKEEYEASRDELINGNEGVKYWEQRTGIEARKALAEAKKKVADLDKNWQETVDKWNVDDQIKLIENRRDADVKAVEEERDAYLASLEEIKNADIANFQATYDYKIKVFNESGQIIFDNSVIQAQNLYNAYKTNFIDPVGQELQKALSANATAPVQETTSAATTYTIKYGDTLSAIAKKYGTTIEKIMSANPSITNKNLIYAGRQLQIPSSHTGSKIIKDGLVNLQAGETVLNMDWAKGLDKLLVENTKSNNNNNNSGNSLNVEGDLVKIEAKIEDKTDINYLSKKVSRELANKFNFKK